MRFRDVITRRHARRRSCRVRDSRLRSGVRTFETLEVRALLAGWGPTDFLVADTGSGRIAVYAQEWTFKEYLDADFPGAAGLDFAPDGDLVAVSSTTQEVRRYEMDGTRVDSFVDEAVGTAGDLKSSPDGTVFIAAGDPTLHIRN